jgi:hypothetical protein
MRTITSNNDSYLHFLQIGNALWIGEDGLELLAGDTETAGDGAPPGGDAGAGAASGG